MVYNFIKKKLWHRRFPVSFPKFLKGLFCRKYPKGCLNEMNHKKCIYKTYSQEDTGDDVLFSAVADMWAYSFSKNGSITDAFL